MSTMLKLYFFADNNERER